VKHKVCTRVFRGFPDRTSRVTTQKYRLYRTIRIAGRSNLPNLGNVHAKHTAKHTSPTLMPTHFTTRHIPEATDGFLHTFPYSTHRKGLANVVEARRCRHGRARRRNHTKHTHGQELSINCERYRYDMFPFFVQEKLENLKNEGWQHIQASKQSYPLSCDVLAHWENGLASKST
jgi:hypothetical protein